MHPVTALFDRNAWVTQRLLQWCSWQRPEVTTSGSEDVYGSVQALFNHILGAEFRYLRLLTGELPADAVSEREPRSLTDLAEPARRLEAAWREVLAAPRDVEELRTHERGGGRTEMPDWLPLVQAFHHGDDHRAQIETLLGRAGVTGLGLDVWGFAFCNPDAGQAAPFADELLRRAFGHHLWATRTLLDHCARLSEEQLALAAPGTYGSILDTLNHLVDSDWGYLRRILQAEKRAEPDPIEDVRRRFGEQSQRWLDYLDSGPDHEALVECSDGFYRAWVLTAQAIHHGNDHRTHVGTVLLHHGLETPDIDVWSYALAEGALREIA